MPDENVGIEAVDAHETERFWAQAAAVASFRSSLTEEGRKHLAAREAEVDAAFDGIE